MTAHYYCPSCGREYDPAEAAGRSYYCCGRGLERRGGVNSEPPTLSGAVGDTGQVLRNLIARQDAARDEAVFRSANGSGTVAVEVIPPAGNTVDALAMEGLLGSLGLEMPFALEIAADASGRRFVVRAQEAVLRHVCSQLESVYGQVVFRPVDEKEDLARRLRVTGMLAQYERRAERTVAMGRMGLRRTEALPLRTYRDGDFREGDPILAVLGGFGRLREGERVLSQLVLRPAPDDWADKYQVLTRPPELRVRVESPLGLAGGMVLAGAIGLAMAAFLRVLTWAMVGKWWQAGLLALVSLPAAWLASRAYDRAWRERMQAEPSQVSRKIFLPGYFFQLRLVAEAETQEGAQRRLRQLAAAYRQFNAGAGNALELETSVFDPCDLDSGWNGRLRLTGTRRDIISMGEAASLWHLPWGDGAQLLRRVLAPQLLPLPEDVAEGVLIGTSTHQGRTIGVRLPTSAMARNKLFVARTRRGKTTLMLHLARAACRLPGRGEGEDMPGVWRPDERRALIFIDPHGDAVARLLGVMPRERIEDVVYLDMGDETRVPGWNLLDTRMGFSTQLLVESFLQAGRRIWSDYWGPRMEDVLRHVVWTLVEANRQRRPEEQYTILDIQAAIILRRFQAQLRQYIVDIPTLRMWWYGYYDELHRRQRLEIVNPVLTKIQRFAANDAVRPIVSRPSSTINFIDLISRGGILLVNLPGGSIGADNTGFLGSLLLTYIEQAIIKQQRLPPAQRPLVSCLIDECQAIPFPYEKLLSQLVKMGADFTLVTQSLAQMEAIDPLLLDATLANIDTLAVFQTSGRDARKLVWELGDKRVEPADIVNLPEHSCLLKTQRDGTPLPVMRVDLMDVEKPDEDRVWAIRQRIYRYTVDKAQAEKEYRAYVEDAYGMDLDAFQEKIRHWRRVADEAERERDVAEAKERSERVMAELDAEHEDGGGAQSALLSVGGAIGDTMPDELEEKPGAKHTRTKRGRE
jgi:hypothetical protein